MRSLALGVISLALLSLLVAPAHAASPATSAPSFESNPALISYVGENITTVPTVSSPAIWTAVSTPYSVFTSKANATQALLRGSPPAGTHSFSLKACTYAGPCSWQNWTVTTYSFPILSGLAYFLPNPGDFYNYSPTASVAGGVFGFYGVPWLNVSSTHGWVTGTVQSGTWLAQLTYSVSGSTVTEFWPITTGALATSITATCPVGTATVTITLPTTDMIQCTENSVMLGYDPYFYLPSNAAGGSYTLGATSGTDYAGYLGTSPPGGNASMDAFFYGSPSTWSAFSVSGSSVYAATLPSSGVAEVSFVPGVQPVTCGTCGGGGGNNPPGNGTTNSTSPAPWSFLGMSLPFLAGMLMLAAIVIAVIVVLAGRRR